MNYYSQTVEQARANGDRSFCVPLAASIVSGRDFDEVNNMMIRAGIRKKGTGSYMRDWLPFFKNRLEMNMVEITSHVLQRARTVRTFERICNPNDRYLVRVKGHLLAVRDGKVQDWTQGRMHRIQQVWVVEGASEPKPASQPAPQPAPQPKTVKPAANEALRSYLIDDYNFSSFELEFAGKFVKWNTVEGTVYLSPSRGKVRVFIRNPETVAAVGRTITEVTGVAPQVTKKYTAWTMSFRALRTLKEEALA